MSKIAREIAEGIEETLIAGNHSKHASYVLGVIPKSELEEFVDTKLAPTRALMERLRGKAVMLHDVLTIYNTHKLGEYPEHCDLCAIHTTYEAWKKEQG